MSEFSFLKNILLNLRDFKSVSIEFPMLSWDLLFLLLLLKVHLVFFYAIESFIQINKQHF